jgi:hypothetical protein
VNIKPIISLFVGLLALLPPACAIIQEPHFAAPPWPFSIQLPGVRYEWPASCDHNPLMRIPAVPPLFIPLYSPLVTSASSVDNLIDFYGGKTHFGTVSVPERIELVKLLRVDGVLVEIDAFASDNETHSVLTLSDAIKLQVFLTSDSSFDWNGEHFCDCIPAFDYRVKFQYGDDIVCVDLDFRSRIARLAGASADGLADIGFEFAFEPLQQITARYFPGLAPDLL